MLHKTSGVILHTVKYSESSLIVKILSPDLGVKSYIINGVRSKKSKFRTSLFQPLSLVEMVVSHKEKANLQRISDIGILYPYSDIPVNVVKSSLLLFLEELLYKAIKEQHTDESIFEFIKNSLQLLDLTPESCANFHLFFMVQLSRNLGFFPEGRYSSATPVFDMLEGRFTGQLPVHSHYIDETLSKLLSELTKTEYVNTQQLQLTHIQRKQLLQALMHFYRLHIEGFGEMKSHEILEQVMA